MNESLSTGVILRDNLPLHIRSAPDPSQAQDDAGGRGQETGNQKLETAALKVAN
jgi:hypothetical protein